MKKPLRVLLAAVLAASAITITVDGASARNGYRFQNNWHPPQNNWHPPQNNWNGYRGNGYRGYGYRGYAYGPALGFGLGFGLGTLLAPNYYPYQYSYPYPYYGQRYYGGYNSAHVQWCLNHYRTYNPATNTYFIRRGVPAVCHSPFG